MASEPTPARAHLDETVDSLPKNPSTWTPKQRAQHAAAADAVTREEAGLRAQGALPSTKGGGIFKRRR